MKTESRFFCQNCGNDFPRWSGQCQSCGAWNSLVEEKTVKAKQTVYKPKHAELNTTPLSIKDIDYNQEERKSSGVEEFDRVLGGGIVPGAVILVGGDPGIGKSTLMLQIANKSDKKILYASGEESAKQIKIRAQRLGALSEKIKV